MNLSHAYDAQVSTEQGERVLLAALDAGVTMFDILSNEKSRQASTTPISPTARLIRQRFSELKLFYYQNSS